jgi:hypothetical protein
MKLASQKGPLGAFDDSNAAKSSSSHDAGTGDAAKDGYTKQAYPSAGPATSNSQIKTIRGSIGSLGNDGTSRGSYKIQPDLVDAENPEPGQAGTGNTGPRAK